MTKSYKRGNKNELTTFRFNLKSKIIATNIEQTEGIVNMF